jgi:hypothetical protein
MGEGYGERVVEEYKSILQKVEEDLFGEFKPTRETISGLRTTARFMYGLDGWSTNASSGLVIAGLGESEAFPVVMCYQVGTIAAGKLRFTKFDEGRVGQDSDAFVIPFAQRKVIDLFYGGVAPQVKEKLADIVSAAVTKCAKKLDAHNSARLSQSCREEILMTLDKEAHELHTEPLTRAVSALPRRELAGLAEALVSLTVFMARMSADGQETVGGPIDVALISKGDGFVWVKRKDPVRDALALSAS